MMWVKRLLWVYFFLLLFEGALRKWVTPGLSNVLLIVRDPIAIVIYALAWHGGFFPRTWFLLSLGFVSIASLAAGVYGPMGSPAAALFGFRANFLHLPLVFVMARAWGREDVVRIGRWTLLVAVPMALLMASQFQASADSWLNVGAGGGEGAQIYASRGHIRPAGLFSFISGPVFFLSMVAAFLFDGQLRRGRYPWPLILLGMGALIVGCVVSGSRSLLGSVALVTACAFFAGFVLSPLLMFRWLWAGALVTALFMAMQNLEIVQEGVLTLTTRIQGASNVEAQAGGSFLGRFFDDYFKAAALCLQAPLWGHGLGVGTQGGVNLLLGQGGFLLSEGEWSRIVLESGPLLGGGFLLWRSCLFLWLGRWAVLHALRGHATPLLLFGVAGQALLSGGFGQATTLGFAVFCGGLCLASMNPAPQKQPAPTRVQAAPEGVVPGVVPGVVIGGVAPGSRGGWSHLPPRVPPGMPQSVAGVEVAGAGVGAGGRSASGP